MGVPWTAPPCSWPPCVLPGGTMPASARGPMWRQSFWCQCPNRTKMVHKDELATRRGTPRTTALPAGDFGGAPSLGDSASSLTTGLGATSGGSSRCITLSPTLQTHNGGGRSSPLLRENPCVLDVGPKTTATAYHSVKVTVITSMEENPSTEHWVARRISQISKRDTIFEVRDFL